MLKNILVFIKWCYLLGTIHKISPLRLSECEVWIQKLCFKFKIFYIQSMWRRIRASKKLWINQRRVVLWWYMSDPNRMGFLSRCLEFWFPFFWSWIFIKIKYDLNFFKYKIRYKHIPYSLYQEVLFLGYHRYLYHIDLFRALWQPYEEFHIEHEFFLKESFDELIDELDDMLQIQDYTQDKEIPLFLSMRDYFINSVYADILNFLDEW